MIIPLNNHIQIEPEKHEAFIASVNDTHEEIGKVIALPETTYAVRNEGTFEINKFPISVGDRVYFDSWMASKFPAGEGKFYWLVPFENIKAYELSLPKVGLQERILTQLQDTFADEPGTSGEVYKVRDEVVLSTEHPESHIPVVPHTPSAPSERSDVSPGVSERA